MTESEAKQSVVALTQLMGWTIDPKGHNTVNTVRPFKIKLLSPTPVHMVDDWITDINFVDAYKMFCFHTWTSALAALCSYDPTTAKNSR